jgi:hypothetical protein
MYVESRIYLQNDQLFLAISDSWLIDQIKVHSASSYGRAGYTAVIVMLLLCLIHCNALSSLDGPSEPQARHPASSASADLQSHDHQSTGALRTVCEGGHKLKVKCKTGAIIGVCNKCEKRGTPCMYSCPSTTTLPAYMFHITCLLLTANAIVLS